MSIVLENWDNFVHFQEKKNINISLILAAYKFEFLDNKYILLGTDLVEWQIKIASGETLPLTQEEIVLNGHAFEARIYAENPKDGFLPGAGVIEYMSTPATSEDVRIDTGKFKCSNNNCFTYT